MITKKDLKILDKYYLCIIDKYDLGVDTLKPTQLGQYMFTEIFMKDVDNYIYLEGGGLNGCYNPDCYLIDKDSKEKIYSFEAFDKINSNKLY